jgi:hypothetical protein
MAVWLSLTTCVASLIAIVISLMRGGVNGLFEYTFATSFVARLSSWRYLQTLRADDYQAKTTVNS